MFSTDLVAHFLHGLSPDKRADPFRSLVLGAQQASTSAGPVPVVPQLGVRRPCAACMQFHRRCEPNCVFASYFPGPSETTADMQPQPQPPQEPAQDAADDSSQGGHAGDDHWGDLTLPLLLSLGQSTSGPGVSTSDPEEDSDEWNKRQVVYVLVFGTTIGLVSLMRSFLPAAYAGWILFVISVVLGVGGMGLVFALHGTSRLQREFSRHVSRLIHAFFSVLMIYGFYLSALHVDDSSASAPSTTHSVQAPDGNYEFWCKIGFGTVGAIVLVAHVYLWIMG